jgi:hypothetical protein
MSSPTAQSPGKPIWILRRQGAGRAEGALRPNKLGVGRDGLAVIFDMRLGRFPSVVHCVFVVTAC